MIDLTRYATPLELRHLLFDVLGEQDADRLLELEPERDGWEAVDTMIAGAVQSWQGRELDRLDALVRDRVLPILTSGKLAVRAFSKPADGPDFISPPFLAESKIEWATDKIRTPDGTLWVGAAVMLPPAAVPEQPALPEQAKPAQLPRPAAHLPPGPRPRPGMEPALRDAIRYRMAGKTVTEAAAQAAEDWELNPTQARTLMDYLKPSRLRQKFQNDPETLGELSAAGLI